MAAVKCEAFQQRTAIAERALASPFTLLTLEWTPRCILPMFVGRHGGKEMAAKRKIEIFSAGCAVCTEAVEAVRKEACSSCEIIVHDMRDLQVAKRAKDVGVRSVPAVVIDGKLASCCADGGIDMDVLRSAGLGKAL
jgi:glutaredoxin